jgi:hypothetical protein
LIKEIQQPQRIGSESTNLVRESIVFPDIGLPDENIEMYGPTAPLSKELQQHPWPQNYKPRIPLFDGTTNPGNFIASYETTVYSARGVIQTLAISLILVVKGVAHDWYMSLKPLSVHSWH